MGSSPDHQYGDKHESRGLDQDQIDILRESFVDAGIGDNLPVLDSGERLKVNEKLERGESFDDEESKKSISQSHSSISENYNSRSLIRSVYYTSKSSPTFTLLYFCLVHFKSWKLLSKYCLCEFTGENVIFLREFEALALILDIRNGLYGDISFLNEKRKPEEDGKEHSEMCINEYNSDNPSIDRSIDGGKKEEEEEETNRPFGSKSIKISNFISTITHEPNFFAFIHPSKAANKAQQFILKSVNKKIIDFEGIGNTQQMEEKKEKKSWMMFGGSKPIDKTENEEEHNSNIVNQVEKYSKIGLSETDEVVLLDFMSYLFTHFIAIGSFSEINISFKAKEKIKTQVQKYLITQQEMDSYEIWKTSKLKEDEGSVDVFNPILSSLNQDATKESFDEREEEKLEEEEEEESLPSVLYENDVENGGSLDNRPSSAIFHKPVDPELSTGDEVNLLQNPHSSISTNGSARSVRFSSKDLKHHSSNKSKNSSIGSSFSRTISSLLMGLSSSSKNSYFGSFNSKNFNKLSGFKPILVYC